MIQGLKAIETVYNGYRFRSRLEARWAVFFDALGIQYEYEKEGFELDGGERYLPDFWLPQQEIWVEVKPEAPEDVRATKTAQLVKASGRGAWIVAGEPSSCRVFALSAEEPTSWLYCHTTDIDGLDLCTRCGQLTIDFPLPCCLELTYPARDPRVSKAALIARSARFEFGERPDLTIVDTQARSAKVYFAGKVEGEWREKLGLPRWAAAGEYYRSARAWGWRYAGPTIQSIDHNTSRHDVVNVCLSEIRHCEAVFAYVDTNDAHGTLVELGYATAFNKPMFVAFSSAQKRMDMWFVANVTRRTTITSDPVEAFRLFENWWNR